MNILRRSIAVATIGVSILTPGLAAAACTQAELAGTWQAYTASFVAGDAFWSRCRLSISAAGSIANTTCVQSGGGSGPLTNGTVRMAIPATCTFTAQFTFGGAVNRVVHATLSRDKILANGVGTFPGGGFTLVMSKI